MKKSKEAVRKETHCSEQTETRQKESVILFKAIASKVCPPAEREGESSAYHPLYITMLPRPHPRGSVVPHLES